MFLLTATGMSGIEDDPAIYFGQAVGIRGVVPKYQPKQVSQYQENGVTVRVFQAAYAVGFDSYIVAPWGEL